jgi:glycosyltransferase involved in cell wall biosynthesis
MPETLRVLLVAHYFPPLVSGGSLRPAKQASWLRAAGHQVRVLTHGYHGDEIGETELRAHDPSHNCHRRGLHRLQWLARRLAVEAANRAGVPASIYSGWRRRAVALARHAVPPRWPSVVLATYPPVETLEVGLALASIWRVPLVADFRDGLLFEPIERVRLARHACVRRHYQEVEARVAAAASALVAVFPGLAHYLASRYLHDRVHLVPNAFDPSDFVDLPAVELPAEAVHLVHAGAVAGSFSGRDIAPLLDALELLGDRNPRIAGRLRVHQLGRLTRSEAVAAAALARSGLWHVHGSVDRRTCLAFERAADALLLVTSGLRPSAAPGKLFEYLGARRPIVALTRGSWAQTIVEATGTGWVVPPDDPAAIADLVARVVSDPAFRAALSPDPVALAEHSLANRMAELERVLSVAALDSPGPGMAESSP